MTEPLIKPEHFINRELSWLEFNARVLEEAQDDATPLLERVKFLSIFSSNLDEFFMVRVAGLREQAFGSGTPQDRNPDGMKAVSQLVGISARTQELVAAQYACLNDQVLPALANEGIHIIRPEEVADRETLDKFFNETVFPIITPMAIDPAHPRSRYHNKGLYLGALLRRRTGLGPKKLMAVVQLPQVMPRLVPVPHEDKTLFVLLEDLVAARLPDLFGGFEVRSVTSFRITRDSDLALLEQESDDMLRLIEERLRARHRADAVRLEVAANADEELVEQIVRQEHIRDGKPEGYTEVYRTNGPLDLTGLMSLSRVNGYEHLHDKPFTPQVPRGLRRPNEDLFQAITRRDILLHHPYDSFSPVVEFVESAANDPKVLAIKQTVYRTSGDSPIIQALIEAADNGKHVTALVELKARFDEAANVDWARQMERSGVHVVYGFMDLKTHCKVSLVVRQEPDGVKRYVHLGTGNYNPVTAKIYTDTGLFTADHAIAEDASALFNFLTGYSQGHEWKRLVVAPEDLQNRTIQLIEEQTERARRGEPSRIFAKFNALVDVRVMAALYRASEAGVPIDLVVRGICCLQPGVPGLSENIRVRSIVDRFLEHSRIFVFGPDEEAQIFMSSADWMPRNFYRRVEVMFPIESPQLKKRVLHEMLPAFLRDNVKARQMRPDGRYERVHPQGDEPRYRSQEELLRLTLEQAAAKNASIADEAFSYARGRAAD
ncbi:MAG: polyphosphate kinase 1 [Pirellulales bacterium]|nr:polyphosphate kinase 1 [Pirellulales bacterium]